MARKKETSELLLDLPVSFGNVSIGDKTANIGVTVDRADLTPTRADKELCEKRLTGRIVAKPVGDHPDQQTFEGMEADTELGGIFDIKGFRVNKDSIALSLTFSLGSVDVAGLAGFAKKSGRMLVSGSEEMPSKDDSEEGDDADEE